MSNSPLLLLVDDKPENLDILISHLEDAGYDLAVALSGEEALEVVESQTPSLILLDVMMPGIDGFQTCLQLKRIAQTKDTPVIFMSALADIDSKVRGFAVGCVDFITKPFQREEVLSRVNAHLTIQKQRQLLQEQNRNLEELNQQLQQQIDQTRAAEQALSVADNRIMALTQKETEQWGIDAFIGNSPLIMSVLEEVRSLQHVDRTNVLVLGESGTGKELISRAIHFGSNRKDKPFVAVNCSAIPVELADAEFFGHTKGAFTGALTQRAGHFLDANGGTLFLDEIGDMPLALQAKLLRVLEDGQVTPVGSSSSKKVNVRVVAATNVDLRDKIENKKFRQDLYFRLSGYVIRMPALRKRLEDIPLLVEHFLHRLAKEMGKEIPAVSESAYNRLQHYHFPGNVRELKNLIEYALISSRSQTIEARHFHFIDDAHPSNDNLSDMAIAINQPTVPSSSHISDEERILGYLRQHGRIDNSSAQELLGVEHSRASYLLKKLLAEGKVQKQGQRRWAYYTL